MNQNETTESDNWQAFLQQEHSVFLRDDEIVNANYEEPKTYNKCKVIQNQKDLINGYIKEQYGDNKYPKALIDLIYKFYTIKIFSSLLTRNEEMSLLNLLWDRLSTHTGNDKMTQIDFKLLYRASENEYSSDIFHELCDNKGATLVIAYNDYNHIYGGYASKSWNWNESTIADKNAFLYVIRPTTDSFGFKDNEKAKTGKDALWNYEGYGPIFGSGNDIWISDACNYGQSNGVNPDTFDFDSDILCGGKSVYNDCKRHWCVVKEYEVFSVRIS